MRVLQGTAADNVEYTAMLASFGPSLNSLVLKDPVRLVAATPMYGCIPLTPDDDYRGRVVLIARDSCSFMTKASMLIDSRPSLVHLPSRVNSR